MKNPATAIENKSTNTYYPTVATLANEYAVIWNLNGQYFDALLSNLNHYEYDDMYAQLGI
jgi:hypothetical protein